MKRRVIINTQIIHQQTHTFRLEGAHGAVHDTRVGLVESAGLQHLALVLHQQLDTLNRSSSRLGDDGGGTTESKVLSKTEEGAWLRFFRHLSRHKQQMGKFNNQWIRQFLKKRSFYLIRSTITTTIQHGRKVQM